MDSPFTIPQLELIAGEWDAAASREEVPAMASLCRRTAESVRIEARTGRVTCVCHLKPVEECR